MTGIKVRPTRQPKLFAVCPRAWNYEEAGTPCSTPGEGMVGGGGGEGIGASAGLGGITFRRSSSRLNMFVFHSLVCNAYTSRV